MEFWIGVSMVICSVAFLRFVVGRTRRGGVVAGGRLEQLEERLAEVERRLVDIQDIVLSIDEKLERPPVGRSAG